MQQQLTEALARLAALKCVLRHLDQTADRPVVEPGFYRYQETLIKGEIGRLEEEINTLQDEHPDLRAFGVEPRSVRNSATSP